MDLSSVTYWEMVNLVGHYNKLIYGESVDPRLLTRGFTEDQIKQMQKSRKGGNIEIISCNLHFKGTLDQWDHPHFGYYITLFDQYYKHGTLPFPGAHADQPAKIMEIFDLLTQLTAERDEKNRKEQEQKQKKLEQRRKRK